MIPHVAAIVPGDVAASALDHHHLLDAGGALQGLVGVGLHRHLAATAHPFVRSDDHVAFGVNDAVFQRIGREAAKHDGMDRADAGAGQHGDGGFRDHRHVNAYPVALLDAEAFQRIGEFADILMQLPVGDFLVFGRIVAFPDDGDLIATGGQMPVQTVFTDIQLAAFKPADVAFGEVPIQNLVPALGPGNELISLLGPKAFGVIDRALVHRQVLIIVDPGVSSGFSGYGIDLDIGHYRSSPLVIGVGV